MGAHSSVFGLNPQGQAFIETVRILKQSPSIRVVSLSAHIGSGIISVEPFQKLARVLLDVRRNLGKQGISIDTIDLGGGFSVPSEVRYSDAARENDTGDTVPSPEQIASFEQVCEAVSKEFLHSKPVKCVMEPGRLLVSDVFHLLTRVVRIKEESGTCFAILDAGRFQNAPFVARGYHEIIPVNLRRRPLKPYTLVGPLCASFDVYSRNRLLPELREGELVAVMSVGAYNLSAQSQWAFPPAPVVSVCGDEASLLEA